MATWTFTDAINAVGDPIDAEVFAELKGNIQAAAGLDSAASTFNGLAGRVITILSQGDTNYFPQIIPVEDPAGNLGEVHFIINSATQFTVYNSGSFRGAFRFKVLK